MDTTNLIENLYHGFLTKHGFAPNALLINPLRLFKLNSERTGKGTRVTLIYNAMKIVRLNNGEKTAVALI